MERIGDARFVLLGEASHGTAEYYRWRAEITRRLIVEKGFQFIAVEGDWPACDHLDRYIKGRGDDGNDARETLNAFDRWPTWMWANEEIAELAEWLKVQNARRPGESQVGFHGLDVYSLWDSLYAVTGYLRRVDPGAIGAAHRAFRCFEPYGEDAQDYARATVRLIPKSCEDEVVALEPLGKLGNLLVGPHPARPAVERLEGVLNITVALTLDVPIELVARRPVALHGEELEALFDDQAAADLGPPGVVVRRPVRRLPQEDEAGIPDPFDQGVEVAGVTQRSGRVANLPDVR